MSNFDINDNTIFESGTIDISDNAEKPQAGYPSPYQGKGFAQEQLDKIVNDANNPTDATAQPEQANDNELSEPQQFYSETKEAEPYPIDAFPEALKGVIEYCVKAIECDASLIGNSVIAGISLALQQHFNILIPTGHIKKLSPLSVAVLSMLDSSERKSTAESKIYKPHKDYQNKAMIENQKLILKAIEETESYNRTINFYRKTVETLNSKIFLEETVSPELLSKLENAKRKQEKWIHANEKPVIPLRNQLIISDTTTEALVRKLEKNTPFLGLVTTEGGILFSGYSMNNERVFHTLSTFCHLLDGDMITIDRVKDEAPVILIDKALMIDIGVQPEAVKQLFNDRKALNQGFLPRFLLAKPKPRAGTRFNTTPKKEIDYLENEFYTPYCNRITELLNQKYKHKDPLGERLERDMITFMEEAEIELKAFYNETEAGQQKGGIYADIGSFASKAPVKAGIIAGLFAGYENTTFITKEHIQRAIKIKRWYLKETARIINGDAEYSQPPYDTERGLAENLRRYLFEKVFIKGNQTIAIRDLIDRKLKDTKIDKGIRELQITQGKDKITGNTYKYHYLIEFYLVANDWLLPSTDKGKTYTVNSKALTTKS